MNAAVKDLVTSIAADAPPPTEGDLPLITGADPNTTSEQLNGSLTNTSQDVDSAGTPWDPKIHEAARGKKSDGTWRRKRGRGAAGASDGASGKPGGLNLPQPPQSPQPPAHLADAAAFVGMITGGHAMLLGKHWLPGADEHPVLVESTRQYLEATGGIQLPPWLGLAGAYLVYASSRFHHVDTKKRVSDTFGKISLWWKKTFKRDKQKMDPTSGKTPPAAATPNSRPAMNEQGGDIGFDPQRRAYS